MNIIIVLEHIRPCLLACRRWPWRPAVLLFRSPSAAGTPIAPSLGRPVRKCFLFFVLKNIVQRDTQSWDTILYTQKSGGIPYYTHTKYVFLFKISCRETHRRGIPYYTQKKKKKTVRNTTYRVNGREQSLIVKKKTRRA